MNLLGDIIVLMKKLFMEKEHTLTTEFGEMDGFREGNEMRAHPNLMFTELYTEYNIKRAGLE